MYIHALVHNLYKQEKFPSRIQANALWVGDEFLEILGYAKCDNINSRDERCRVSFIESWFI
jgi:hypothetical protein